MSKTVLSKSRMQIDDRDRAILAALGPDPIGIVEVCRRIGKPVQNIRAKSGRWRNVKDRLERLDGVMGVEAVKGRGGVRLWRRQQVAVAPSTAEATGYARGSVGSCLVTGKFAYVSEHEADAAIRRIRKGIGHGRHRPARSYYCPWCDAWHITSAAAHQPPH